MVILLISLYAVKNVASNGIAFVCISCCSKITFKILTIITSIKPYLSDPVTLTGEKRCSRRKKISNVICEFRSN